MFALRVPCASLTSPPKGVVVESSFKLTFGSKMRKLQDCPRHLIRGRHNRGSFLAIRGGRLSA